MLQLKDSKWRLIMMDQNILQSENIPCKELYWLKGNWSSNVFLTSGWWKWNDTSHIYLNHSWWRRLNLDKQCWGFYWRIPYTRWHLVLVGCVPCSSCSICFRFKICFIHSLLEVKIISHCSIFDMAKHTHHCSDPLGTWHIKGTLAKVPHKLSLISSAVCNFFCHFHSSTT